MQLGIEGRLALVTGAGRGLGRGICEALAAEGVKLIAVSRGEAGLDELQEVLSEPSEHIYLSLDLEKPDAIDELTAKVKSKGLRPDIIVNNVGGNLGFTEPLSMSEGWGRVMHLNLETAIGINEAFIPDMQKKKWGRICHISSIAALENQGPPAYCAAKAALNAYVRSAGRYLAPDNVIMTSVMPGAVFTEGGYWDHASRDRPEHVRKYLEERMAIKRFGTVNEISGAVLFLCSELSSFCVGTCMLIDGGQGRVFYPNEA